MRYALLVDGAFLRKRLYRTLGYRHATGLEVVAACQRIRSHPSMIAGSLPRIHYYDAPPGTGQITNPPDGATVNLRRSATFARMTALQDQIESSADCALRRGEVVTRGWRLKEAALRQIVRNRRALKPSDLVPDLRQKGVDLRMGLDIARLSLRRLVDVIVVVTGDSDLVPAFRFDAARGSGSISTTSGRP